MTAVYSMRRGAADDVDTIVYQRVAMFRDMRAADDAALASMTERFRPWLETEMAAGRYQAWLIESEGKAVAGAGVWLKEVQPGTRARTLRIPYILDVLVERDHRRRGLARQLMDAILEWARSEGHEIVELHASDEGRPLYEALGFVQTNEMRLLLNESSTAGPN